MASAEKDEQGRTAVLLLDDNPEAASAMKRWFERLAGFRWAGSTLTPDTLDELIRRENPDVVLVDFHMPGVDTCALLARVVKDLPRVRFAVLSANLNPKDIRSCLAAGVAGYLYKDQSPAHLAAEVKMVAAGRTVLSAEAQSALVMDTDTGT
jgi:DNA-binding NarL/FixJ family response regulator